MQSIQKMISDIDKKVEKLEHTLEKKIANRKGAQTDLFETLEQSKVTREALQSGDFGNIDRKLLIDKVDNVIEKVEMLLQEEERDDLE